LPIIILLVEQHSKNKARINAKTAKILQKVAIVGPLAVARESLGISLDAHNWRGCVIGGVSVPHNC
jgi:hypothetical protein